MHEIPVDWVADPHSSVDIVATAVADLRGIARMRRRLRDWASAGDASPIAGVRRLLQQARGVPLLSASQYADWSQSATSRHENLRIWTKPHA